MGLDAQKVLDILDKSVFDVCAAAFKVSVVAANMVKLSDIQVQEKEGLDHVKITMHLTRNCGNAGEDLILRNQVFTALAKPMAASISDDPKQRIEDLEKSGRLDLQMPKDYNRKRLAEALLVGMPQAIFDHQTGPN